MSTPSRKQTKKSTRSPAPAATQRKDPTGFVGIGGSAGSLEVLQTILEGLPADFDMALVVVQHLAPHVPSMVTELLAARTSLRVETVTKTTRMRAGVVYVMPPDVLLEMAGNDLRVMPAHVGETRNGIDFLLASMAQDPVGPIVGIVLSGSSSDGALGLKEIKGAAGFTIAQDPRTTRFDAAPHAAIMTGAVDKILRPEEIAPELVNIWKHPLVKPDADLHKARREDLSAAEEQLKRIFALLRNASGVDFTHYKQPTIKRRMLRRMVLHKITTLDQYLKFLQANPGEVTALYQDILIHVTRFFREADSFKALASRVFPNFKEARSGETPIRVWVPGCSTGEEPYSVAMALLEFLAEEGSSVPLQIFATDVSESAIEQARAGVYPESIAEDVSAERLRRFFTKTDGSYRVAKLVRDCCVFARQDLTRDPPFSRLDLIVCRNVLIYLGPVLQKRLMNVFHYALKATGFLMLGGAETVGPHTDLFAVADKRHKIYTKKVGGSRTEMDFRANDQTASRAEAARRAPAETRPANSVQNEANRIILARYSPPGVIVDNDLKIVQFRGQTGAYFEPAPGEASLNLLKMAREGLLYGLRTAIHEARKKESEARKEGLRVRAPEGIVDVTVCVIPLGQNSPEGRHFLVLFEAPKAPSPPAPAKAPKPKGKTPKHKDDGRVARLQQELAASREYLQSIIQDLEAANEELQSANEEILSSNEELQSTNEELDTAKEELQSTNEELNTLNEELHGRNEELMHVNSDLVNLLASVHIAIVMVDSDLRIRRFTPMAEKVLNLIPTDIGRPISDIKPNFDCNDLEKLITESIDTVTIKEREVHDRKGNLFSLRIRPYKNVENRIDGAVLALFDGTRKPGT